MTGSSEFHKMSPFLVQKYIKAFAEEPKSIKRLRSGDLLMETVSANQSKTLLTMSKMGQATVTVSAHKTLNSSRSVISEVDLLTVSNEKFIEELAEQNVCNARRIKIKRDGQLIDTKHVVLTFNTPQLPNHIKAGYLHCPVRPYVPNPMRCFQCQWFGHSKDVCRGTPTSARCSSVDHNSEGCNAEPLCVNCKGSHPSFSRSCPKWKSEKEIQRATKKISYTEAKRLLESTQPRPNLSFADATKSVRSIAIQTSLTTQTKPKSEIPQKTPSSNLSASTKHIPTHKKPEGTNIKKQTKSSLNSANSKTVNSGHTSLESLVNIKSLIDIYQPACFGVQETYLKQESTAKLRRYSTVRKDFLSGERIRGGVAILTSHTYPLTVFPLNTCLQAVAVQINISMLVTVCTIYLPPNEVIDKKELDDLVEQLPTPFIVIGDFNGHNHLWGSGDTNFRGKQIEDLICDYCLCLLNSGEQTYFHQPTRTFHSIDLAICSPSLLPFCSFSVGNDIFNSDHFPIFLTLNQITAWPNARSPRFIYEQADWEMFSHSAMLTNDMIKNTSIEEAVNTITDTPRPGSKNLYSYIIRQAS
ncbi:putative RNA-directed DNA polymerase from transposon X-element, partial [Stegodyphus mimosarum]